MANPTAYNPQLTRSCDRPELPEHPKKNLAPVNSKKPVDNSAANQKTCWKIVKGVALTALAFLGAWGLNRYLFSAAPIDNVNADVNSTALQLQNMTLPWHPPIPAAPSISVAPLLQQVAAHPFERPFIGQEIPFSENQKDDYVSGLLKSGVLAAGLAGGLALLAKFTAQKTEAAENDDLPDDLNGAKDERKNKLEPENKQGYLTELSQESHVFSSTASFSSAAAGSFSASDASATPTAARAPTTPTGASALLTATDFPASSASMATFSPASAVASTEPDASETSTAASALTISTDASAMQTAADVSASSASTVTFSPAATVASATSGASTTASTTSSTPLTSASAMPTADDSPAPTPSTVSFSPAETVSSLAPVVLATAPPVIAAPLTSASRTIGSTENLVVDAAKVYFQAAQPSSKENTNGSAEKKEAPDDDDEYEMIGDEFKGFKPSFAVIDPQSQAGAGAGRSRLGHVVSGACYLVSTGSDFVTGHFLPYEYEPSIDPQIKAVQALLAQRKLLTPTAINLFFQKSLEGKVKFNLFQEFYCRPMNHWTMNEIVQFINSKTEEKTFDRSQPICIPIVMEGSGISHITALLIKDGIVEYYDSKGQSIDEAKEYFLAKDSKDSTQHSLADVLEFLAQFFEAKTLVLNADKHQGDFHSCGVHVCRFFKLRLIDGIKILDAGGKYHPIPSLSKADLENFRKKMLEDISPPKK